MNPWLENTRWIRYSLMVLAGLGGVLLFILASAASNTGFFESNYSVLIALNGAIAFALLCILLLLAYRVAKRYRAGVFGSRLMLRMSVSFALMGLIPGLLLYLVSVQFLARSLDSWFDVRVDSALESGLNLGQTALDSLMTELAAKGQSVAMELSRTLPSQQLLELSRLREAASVQELTLLSESAQVIGSSGGGLDSLLPNLPSSTMLRQALMTRPFQQIEPDPIDPENRLLMRVVVPVAPPFASFEMGQRYVQIIHPVPASLSSRANAVQSVYRDYQELQLSRSGLRKIYGITLTLALLLTMFLSVAVALWLSSRLSAPLLWLAEGTKALAGGDFKAMPPVRANDELRDLLESFSDMTRQLLEAQRRVQSHQAALSANNEFLQSLLGSLSSGVLVLDAQGRIKMFNEGAVQLFERSLADTLGKPLSDLRGLGGFANTVLSLIQEYTYTGTEEGGVWQRHVELPKTMEGYDDAGVKQILVRGSRLPGQAAGHVLVCDDITALISAQRNVAWGEVARRLAHEIKNPLTPIQLSAERLSMKLSPLLQDPELGILQRATRTIVAQVESLKKMVNAFRDYARLPKAELKPIDINELLTDVISLYDIEQSSPTALQWQLSLAKNLPSVDGDLSLLAQVFHNLLQNAIDASCESKPQRLEVRTELQCATNSNIPIGVRVSVLDNGPGFKPDLLAKVFEPYVTTKAKGTGLGLAIVKKIMDEHRARIAIRNKIDLSGSILGAMVELTFPIASGATKIELVQS